ncbi:GAF domain-containing protein [Mucilaginibacter myungsuensis]|uniref:GAF domain-containing protein n=1 Tax=Mucilaginibacter myungsuensis TaxID=649104 RepID=A0A929PVM6_9SPHI|nr:GAF domain-containing protein [Mucilaginibacter myungsuensis]MBE9660262.1 GAF domain-containing protein [Mucilaginibacter myungsuensis]MDN3600304.1 GAF domain-containing protein [Mucilaginibacter myungsuensis]
MLIPQFLDNPFKIELSFHKIIERYEDIAANATGYEAERAKSILKEISPYPELRDGFVSAEQIEQDAEVISHLLAEIFPAILTDNEIKAVSLPFLNINFNHTRRFKSILDAAGKEFDLNIRDFDEHQFYIASCCIILNEFYGTQLNFSKPLFADIPDARGIMKHYRILYNADFVEIVATENAPILTQKDLNKLMNNYDDLALWKKTFPSGAWILKGFSLMSLVDVTVENAVSSLKSSLLGTDNAPDLQDSMSSIFKSIFKVTDIDIGFTSYDQEEGRFSSKVFGQKTKSYMMSGKPDQECDEALCSKSFNKIIKRGSYFAIADVDDFTLKNPDSCLGQQLQQQGIKSAILAPVIKNDQLLGILELVSHRAKEFNSVNAHKLEVAMPYIVDSIDRKLTDIQNKIAAVIQNYYTTLHPSVDWKFQREAQNYIQKTSAGINYTLKEIVFKDVYPLYGQVDIKDSSITRNKSVITDLTGQLNQLVYLLKQVEQYTSVFLIEQHLNDLQGFVEDLTENIKADSEQSVKNYLATWIYPLLRHESGYSVNLQEEIAHYFEQIDEVTGEFHLNRRSYEKTLSLINEKLAVIMDKRQDEAQKYFPHYFERFKTDGVEHNLYIGATIAPKLNFAEKDLRRLRLWQLMVIAEMSIEHHHLKQTLPFPLDVTSLILVFSNPISIRFRMDEKHFDIDGAYNVRYEVIKKRIDKSRVLGTNERITQPGKITIIYSKTEEEAEYSHYINILQRQGVIGNLVENFEVEDLQGVSGLKALRLTVQAEHNLEWLRNFNYQELYK